MHLIVVEATNVKPGWLRSLALPRGQRIAVLPLGGAGEAAASVAEWVADVTGTHPETIDVGDEGLKEAAFSARGKYIDAVARWPEQYRHDGKSLKELLVSDGLSLWWLSRARMKDQEESPTFGYLFHLELLERLHRDGPIEGLHLISEHRGFRDLVRQWAARQGIALVCHPRGSEPDPRTWLARWAVSRLWFTAKAMLGYLLAKLLILLPGPAAPSRDEVAFLTYLGDTAMIDSHGIHDRNYARLPDHLGEESGLSPVYAAFVYDRPVYLLRNLRRILANRDRLALLEAYLPLRAFVGTLFGVGTLLRFLALDRDRRFREAFDYEGLSVYPLIRPELLGSFVGPHVTQCLLLGRGFEHLTRRRPLRFVVSFLELYPEGLAVYWGAKRGRPETTTVAYQHAGVTHMKLWYSPAPSEVVPDSVDSRGGIDTMPIPDNIVCQGGFGRRVFLEAGFPDDACLLTGSPRYDALKDAANLAGPDVDPVKRLGVSPGKRLAVVATPYDWNHTMALLRAVADAFRSRPEWHVAVKPHPVQRVQDIATEMRRPGGLDGYSIVDLPIPQLARMAGVLVTTYSTAADEAIAMGCPAIVFQDGMSFFMGTFWEVAAGPIVRSSEALGEALDTLGRTPDGFAEYRDRWEELIEGSFHRVDGMAHRRVTEALSGLHADTPPTQDVRAKATLAR